MAAAGCFVLDNFPLGGGELATSLPRDRVRRDASRAVSRSGESYSLIITIGSRGTCRTSAVLSSRWPQLVRPALAKLSVLRPNFLDLVREVRHSVWLNSSPKTPFLGFRACRDRGHVQFLAEGCMFPEVCAVPSSSAVVQTLRESLERLSGRVPHEHSG